MTRKLALLLLFVAAPLVVSAGTIYVSPKGNDQADGSQQSPLRTPHAALKMAREWRRIGDPRIEGGIEIRFQEGIYTLDRPLYIRPEDSGTADSPTTLRAEEGKEVVFSGGTPLASFRRADGYWVAEAPKVHGRPLLVRDLWGGTLRRATQFGAEEMARMIAFDPTTESITIPRPAIEGLEQAEGLEMLVHQRWAVAILRIKAIRYEGEQAVVTFLNPESYLEFAHPWPQPVIDGERGNSSFMLMNAKALLDEHNEWWQDYTSGRIYTLRKPRTTIYAPHLERLMTIEGARQKVVQHLRFEGIRFAHTAWNRPMEQGHVTLQGGFAFIDGYKLYEKEGFAWDPNLENQAWLERPEAAISVRNASHITFEGCSFHELGATGLDLVSNVHHTSVRGCTFQRIGGTALLAGSFGEGATEVHIPFDRIGDPTDFCSHLHIEANRIYDVTCTDWGAVAIGCGYVRDTEIVDNHINKVNYSGICVGWGWTKHDTGMHRNRIARNRVENYARQLYDAGGIYTLSNQPGSVIEQNIVSKPYPAPYATNHRGFCIYLDAATDGYTIRNNWLEVEASIGFNNPGPAVHFEGTNGPETPLPQQQ